MALIICMHLCWMPHSGLWCTRKASLGHYKSKYSRYFFLMSAKLLQIEECVLSSLWKNWYQKDHLKRSLKHSFGSFVVIWFYSVLFYLKSWVKRRRRAWKKVLFTKEKKYDSRQQKGSREGSSKLLILLHWFATQR